MRRDELGDLYAFRTVANEESFTRAAVKLGTSQSALSHTIRRLETDLGGPAVDPDDAQRGAHGGGRTAAEDARAGARRHCVGALLGPGVAREAFRNDPHHDIGACDDDVAVAVLEKFLRSHPDIHVELNLDSGLANIVADRFDAGVRLGEPVAKEMVAVRIGPELRMVVIGAPSYFAKHGKPKKPQDLASHSCINLRLPTSGGFYSWELQKGKRELKVRVEGQLAFNSTPMIVRAAAAGFGLGFVMEDQVKTHLAAGSLVTVLDDWCPPFGGYHLCYPSRRQPLAAFTLLVEALRFKAK